MIVFFGSLAALLTAICWVPQVHRTWRRNEAADHFAWPYLALLGSGVALWCLYGVFREDAPIYLCNAFVLACVLFVVMVKYRRRQHARDEAAAPIESLEAAETEP